MDRQDASLVDFFRVNFFFENYDLFIRSLFELSSESEISELIRGTKSIHYAEIVSAEAFFNHKLDFVNQGYELTNTFRSAIIEKLLREKYSNDNIVVNIKKVKDTKNQEIEFFVVESGLTNEQIKKENFLLRHFAIESEDLALKTLKECLLKNKFKEVGGGKNKQEKSSTLYYEKYLGKNQLIRLELFKKDKS